MRLFLAVFFVLQLSLSSVYFGQAETIFDGTKKEYWTNLTSRTDNGGKIRGAVSSGDIYKLLNEGVCFGVQSTDNEKNKAINFSSNPKNIDIQELKHVSFQIGIENFNLTGDSSFIEFGLFGDRTLQLRKGLNNQSKFDLFLKKDKIFIELHNFREQDPDASSILITLKYEISNDIVGFPEINLKINNYEIASIPYNNLLVQKRVFNKDGHTTPVVFSTLKQIYDNFKLNKIEPYFYSSAGNSFTVSTFKVSCEKIENLKQEQNYTKLIPQKLDKSEKKVALLIGSNIYGNDKRNIKDLNGVPKDYKLIESKLREFNYDIIAMPPKGGLEPVGYVKNDVINKIKELNNWLSKNKDFKTKVIVYFAGHGFLDKDTINGKNIQCFALFDDVKKPGVYDILNESHFYSVAKNCTEFLLISDACRVSLPESSRGVVIRYNNSNNDKQSNFIKVKNSVTENKSLIMLAANDDEVTADEINTLTQALVQCLEYDLSLSQIEKRVQSVSKRDIQFRECTDENQNGFPRLENLFIHKLSPK